MKNLPATIHPSTLSREIGEQDELLKPPSYDMVASGIKWLMDAGMKAPTGISGDVVAKYHEALGSVPMVGLRTAFTKLKRGLYENINLDFIPTPATMAAMARLEAKPVAEHRIRLQETLQTLSAPKPEAKDKTAIERVRNLRISLMSAHKASKDGSNAVLEEPISEDKAAYWRKISNMPDKVGGADEEQLIFRSKIQNKINHTKET